MSNIGFKGLSVRQTGSLLLFRASLKSLNGNKLATGTTTLALYEYQSDGTLKSYDFNDNTFKTTALTTATLAMTHRAGNNGTVNTGVWTVLLSTLTGLTIGAVYMVQVNNTNASPPDQEWDFQYGGAEGDLIVRPISSGQGILQGEAVKTRVPGLIELFEPAQGGTYKDLGITLCADNDSVEQYSDLAGSEVWQQLTSGNRPVYKATAGPGGLPSIKFTAASNQSLVNTRAAGDIAGLGAVNRTSWTEFFVFKTTSAPGSMTLFSKTGPNTDARIWMMINAGVVGRFLSGVMNFAGANVIATGTTYIVCHRVTQVGQTIGANTAPAIEEIFINGQLAGEAVTNLPAADAASSWVMGAISDGTVPYDGYLSHRSVYDRSITDDERESIEADLSKFGAIIVQRPKLPKRSPLVRIHCIGDSITNGGGAEGLGAPTYPGWMKQLLGDIPCEVINYGVTSQTLAQMQANSVTTELPNMRQDVLNLVILAGGSNDLAGATGAEATLQTNFAAYCNSLRSDNCIVFAATVIDRTGGFGGAQNTAGFATDRATFNAYVRTNYAMFADGLIDWGNTGNITINGSIYAAGNLGANNASASGTWFTGGHVHPTGAGNELMAQIGAANILAKLTSLGLVRGAVMDVQGKVLGGGTATIEGTGASVSGVTLAPNQSFNNTNQTTPYPVKSTSGFGPDPVTVTITNSTTSIAIPGAAVWITLSADGSNAVTGQVATDLNGQALFYLTAGQTYYLFMTAPGENPIKGQSFVAVRDT